MASRIAVIDDDEGVRSSIASLIRSFGLEARTFSSADNFLESGDRRFECLLCDIQMPGTTGLVLQQLVAKWPEPIPMILISTYFDRAQAALDAGAVCFLEKPIDSEQLEHTLELVLRPLGPPEK